MTTIEQQTTLFKQHMPVFLHGDALEASIVAADLTATCTDEWTYRSLVVLFASVAGDALRDGTLPIRSLASSSFFATTPDPSRTRAKQLAVNIVTAAANRDVEMIAALSATVAGPDAPDTNALDSVLLQVGGLARSLHRRVCGGTR